MFKTLIKLLIAALVVNATWRAGNVYLKYFRFKDDVHEAALFAARQSDSQVQAKVMSLAEQFDIPLKPENVSITRNERRTVINAVYTDEVELVPTKFYPWEFKVSVEALNLTP